MIVKVYGQFCSMYDELLKNVKMAIKCSGKRIDLEVYNKNTDFVKENIIYLPSLKIDESVVSEGKVLSMEQILQLLNKI